jgi:arsenate reductase (thioredoxin)
MSRMKGSPARPVAPPVSRPPVKKVLFLCFGNACRSQMAEGFARKYGADVLVARSAGLAPAYGIPALTHAVMREKNISIEDQFPKSMEMLPGERFDLIVNMSGQPVPAPTASAVEEWTVRDPIGESEEVYRAVRDDIEERVMRLVLSLRSSSTRI